MPISRTRIQSAGAPVQRPAAQPKPVTAKAPAPAAKIAMKPSLSLAEAGLEGVSLKTVTMATMPAACGHEITFPVSLTKDQRGNIKAQTSINCPKCRRIDRAAAEAKARAAKPLTNMDAKADAKEAQKARLRWAKNSPYPWAEPGDLPRGATMAFRQNEDTTWAGECTAAGLTVRTIGIGPARQVPWLAGVWLEAKAKEVSGETTGAGP